MYTDFRQFYMLQKEALKYFLKSIREYFRHQGRIKHSNLQNHKNILQHKIFRFVKYVPETLSRFCNCPMYPAGEKSPKMRLKRTTYSSWQAVCRPQQGEAGQPEPESEPEPSKGAGNLLQQVTTRWWISKLFVFRYTWFCQFMLIMWYPGWWVFGQA